MNFSLAGETHTALVNSIEAIVYSDPLLKHPIGKVSRGEHIAIGQPLEKIPSVVPVIVSGRVAYIKLADLFLDYENDVVVNGKKYKSTAHDPNLMDNEIEENMHMNNSAYFSVHSLSAGTQFQQLFQNIDGISQSTLTGFSANYIHHSTNSRLLWGAGFDYYTASSTNIDFNFYFFKPTLGYTALKYPYVMVDLLGSYGLSLNATFKNRSNPLHPGKGGFLYGPDLEARFIFLPLKKYHPTLGIGYSNYRVLYSNSYFDSLGTEYPGVDTISGGNISLGVAIEI